MPSNSPFAQDPPRGRFAYNNGRARITYERRKSMAQSWTTNPKDPVVFGDDVNSVFEFDDTGRRSLKTAKYYLLKMMQQIEGSQLSWSSMEAYEIEADVYLKKPYAVSLAGMLDL